MLLYALVAIAPLVIALTADPPPGRGWWTELSVGLGFVGLAMLGLQFAVVSRFASVNAPFGLDAVLRYHRQISFVAFAFVLAHPTILIVDRGAWALLDPVGSDWVTRFGQIAVVGLAALIGISVWRTQLRLGYEIWRVAHGLLAVVIVVAALAHIESVGYYVDGPWKRGLWVVMSLAFVTLTVNVRLVKPLRLWRQPWRVQEVRAERGHTWTFTVRPEGHDGISFLPGQFAWLRVDRSPFSIREHPFSFSSSAEETGAVSFTIKEAGDFTSTVGDIPEGTRVFLDGPYGVFTYERNEGPSFVFIAGGAGIAPIMSMLRTLADRGDERSCVLVYGNPSWDEVTYREELAELRGRLHLDVVHVIEDPPEDWDGEQGFIDDGILDRHLPSDVIRARYFICGPPPMMATAQDLLEARDVPPEHVELEDFDLI